MPHIRLSALFIVFFVLLSAANAQNAELAATLEVLNPGVEVRRVNTSAFLPVQVEAIVGVGDIIRTDATGRARITFFANGIDTELLPDTQYGIVEFEGEDAAFNLTVEIIAGQTLQRIGRALDANSNYNVNTPSMSLAARGTAFSVRVEESGRAGMLVTEGTVTAAKESAEASVPPEFGIRAAVSEALSEVVRASTFAELDSALDGCDAVLTTVDDVSINVRATPSREAELLGTILPDDVSRFFGVVESGDWYRIPYQDGFGWVLSTGATIAEDCAGLRTFPDNVTETGEATEAVPDSTPEP